MHPTPKCCTLMCDHGFRLFEGDGRMIAFPLGSVSPLAMRLQACQIIILYDPYLKFSLLRPLCRGLLEQMTNPSLQIQPLFLIVALVHLKEKIMRKADYEGEAL